MSWLPKSINSSQTQTESRQVLSRSMCNILLHYRLSSFQQVTLRPFNCISSAQSDHNSRTLADPRGHLLHTRAKLSSMERNLRFTYVTLPFFYSVNPLLTRYFRLFCIFTHSSDPHEDVVLSPAVRLLMYSMLGRVLLTYLRLLKLLWDILHQKP